MVVLPGKTWLSGSVRDPLRPASKSAGTWSKVSGPGDVTFDDAASAETNAAFSAPGDYVLKFSAGEDNLRGEDTLRVNVVLTAARRNASWAGDDVCPTRSPCPLAHAAGQTQINHPLDSALL